MKITTKDVDYVSKLALLHFEEGAKEVMARELSSILAYMEKMAELDTAQVPPTAHMLQIKNVFRPDQVVEAEMREEALAIAPQREGSYFKVLPIPGIE
jgi:aspartyl-tRNA(Asn)/glutamyl-tRNA(Gln) amidotransferase subunit C